MEEQKKEEKSFFGKRQAKTPVDDNKRIAKKNFEIHQNEYDRVIKEGDDLSDIPEVYLPNLKAEGVL